MHSLNTGKTTIVFIRWMGSNAHQQCSATTDNIPLLHSAVHVPYGNSVSLVKSVASRLQGRGTWSASSGQPTEPRPRAESPSYKAPRISLLANNTIFNFNELVTLV